MSAKIITIAIEKGGTGKTVTASNLAYLMGDEGKKVLCVWSEWHMYCDKIGLFN